MAETWYPVIDYDLCAECGACVAKCCNGVYVKGKSRPEVVNPNNCVSGCRGCQKLCPTGAISYIGDTGKIQACDCKCACN